MPEIPAPMINTSTCSMWVAVWAMGVTPGGWVFRRIDRRVPAPHIQEQIVSISPRSGALCTTALPWCNDVETPIAAGQGADPAECADHRQCAPGMARGARRCGPRREPDHRGGPGTRGGREPQQPGQPAVLG